MNDALHGLLVRFASPGALLAALRRLRANGFTRIEVNTPHPVEGLDEFLPGKPTPIASAVLAGALLGGAGGYFLQWFAARDYPYNAGGRPLHSWPSFVPVTFELTVLAAALAGVGALFWLTGLPRLDHPVFAAAGFERASQDRYFVCVRADDPRYDREKLAALFTALGAETIEELAA